MSEIVSIKGNKNGITLYLTPSASFEELKCETALKFEAARDFLGSKDICLIFEGKKIDSEEQKELVDIIEAKSDVKVILILEENDKERKLFDFLLAQKNESSKEMVEKKEPDISPSVLNSSFVYKGNIRSGRVLEVDESIVILGDVNAGASISSKGNIVVLGSMRGNAFAGKDGDKSAFVFALEMDPLQIRIANVLACKPDEKEKSKKVVKYKPKLAYIDNDTICVESYTKTVLNRLIK